MKETYEKWKKGQGKWVPHFPSMPLCQDYTRLRRARVPET